LQLSFLEERRREKREERRAKSEERREERGERRREIWRYYDKIVQTES
jgi:hypothetical protein